MATIEAQALLTGIGVNFGFLKCFDKLLAAIDGAVHLRKREGI